ncbi:hypothetical protein GRI89_05550 [Altererythrobacter salegens]|uniref:DUF8021 domain-containing protein n=1 Tax=Croceibacterium salegens TaxID=1737568 RepID=A0A6I4SSN2_9SPHN|nr:hypothetical protein [Croceibacterium salegens]MXO59001.1 hypothetical protein [Croceibacterium salegens]
MRPLRLLAALAAFVLATPASAQDCDRACLKGLLDGYIEALVAHEPGRVPTTPDVRMTENTREVPFGEGEWQTVTGIGTFRHDYLDTGAQVAAAHVHLLEGAIPVLYSVVLHVKDSRIAGVEAIVHKVQPGDRFQPKVLGEPVRGMDTTVPPGAAMSRADMVQAALSYTEGLRIGNFTTSGTGFASETYRVENGVITSGAGCPFYDCGMYATPLMLHPDIAASVAAVDEEAGTVLLWMNFGDTNSYGPGNALVTLEAFKIWGGQIHAINAFFSFLPHEARRNWTTTDPLPADSPFPLGD